MQTASGAFATAMLSPDQLVTQRVLLTLPAFQVDGVTAIPSSYGDVSDCVVSIKGDVAVTTTSPGDTLQIDGYSSMAIELVLSGSLKQASGVPGTEAMTVYKLFNSNDATSPLFRLDKTGIVVTLQEGRYVGAAAVEYITVGTLTVDTIATSGGTVTLTLLDGRNTVRGPANLPPVITAPPQNSELTSSFAVDYLFRHASPGKYLSRPAQHPNCVLSVGFESSIWPEVGTLKPLFVQGPAFAAGPYGTGLGSNGLLTVFTPSAPLLTTDKNCCHLLAGGDFEVNVNDDPATYQIIFQRSGTTLFLYTQSPSGQTVASWSITAGNRELEYSISWPASSTSVTGTVWIDGVPNTVSFTAKDARPVGRSFTIVAAAGSNTGALRGLQITNEASYATYYPFTPTLILDMSLNPLTALPDTNGRDIWPVLQDIAAAESAVINIDELNVAHFVNRNTIAAKTSGLNLSSRVNLTALDWLEQRSTVATHVQVPVAPLVIQSLGTVWQATGLINVQPGVPLVLLVQPSNGVLNVPAADSGFYPGGTFGGSPTVGATYWQGCRTLDGLGAPVTTGITIAVVQLSAKRLQVTITNSTSLPVSLVTPTGGYANTVGQPALWIGGQPVVNNGGSVVADSQWPPASVGGASSGTKGDILLTLAANDWLQDLGTGQLLADHLLSDFHVPLPVIRNTSMVSDPRLQLLDRITLLDPDISLASLDALVVGQHLQLGGGPYWTRSLDLRAYWPPGAWVLGVAGMSELGDGASVVGTAYAY